MFFKSNKNEFYFIKNYNKKRTASLTSQVDHYGIFYYLIIIIQLGKVDARLEISKVDTRLELLTRSELCKCAIWVTR